MLKRFVVGAVAWGLVVAGCGDSDSGGTETAAGTTGDGPAGSGGSAKSGGGSGDGSGGGKTSGGSSATGGKKASGGSNGTTESGGTSSDGGTSSASGGSSPASDVGAVGTACDEPGALSCAGTAQRVVTVCGADGLWDAIDTCAADEVCDSRPGETHATCQVPDPECEGQAGGYRFCEEVTVFECSADGIAEEVETCAELCSNGACDEAAAADPCPTERRWINCADDCGGRSPECVESGPCFLVDAETFPVVVRTPAAADACWCSLDESTGRKQLTIVGQDSYFFRVTAGASWWFLEPGEDCSAAPTGFCHVAGEASAYAFLLTDDPNAPPRNVLIEEVPEGTTCP